MDKFYSVHERIGVVKVLRDFLTIILRLQTMGPVKPRGLPKAFPCHGADNGIHLAVAERQSSRARIEIPFHAMLKI